MPIVLSLQGKLDLLNQKLDYLGGLYIHLFQNDITPTATTIATDFTEATFPGYATQLLGAWGFAYLEVERACTIHDPVLWMMTGASPTNDIYGYYITDALGHLIYSERKEDPPVPAPMNEIGDTYVVVPKFCEDTLGTLI